MARLGALVSFLSLVVAGFAVPSKRDITLKKRSTYALAFGPGGDPDASVQGYGYLSFTRLDAYDIPTCESWCDQIAACAFINLFYEYNSDAIYNPQVKCVAYAVPHTAADKTSFGGQQLLLPPAGPTYVEQSVGYTSVTFANPPLPAGYSLVFGPLNSATDTAGLITSQSLSFYDTQGCADQCTQIGDSCLYFNIWLGVQSGNPTYTCALYSASTDASTATNTGQDGEQVTNSRGYARIVAPVNLISDGGFEDNDNCSGYTACWVNPTSPWSDNTFNTLLMQNKNDGQDGKVYALLSNAGGNILRYTPTLNTVPGQAYLISVKSANIGGFNGVLRVYWNGVIVLNTAVPPRYVWTTYTVQVTAVGNDNFGVGAGGNTQIGVDDVSITVVR